MSFFISHYYLNFIICGHMGVTYICYDNSDKEDSKTNSDSDDLTVMKPPFLPFLFCFLVTCREPRKQL